MNKNENSDQWETSILVTSWNLHKGRSPLGKQAWSEMRSCIQDIQADVFFLQEAMARRLVSAPGIARFRAFLSQENFSSEKTWHCQATELASLLNYKLILGQNVFKPSWRHGNAIISSYPLRLFGKWDISAHSFERRGLLVAVMCIAGLNITLLCAHLALTRKARLKQMSWVADWIDVNASSGPLILAGDFNDWKNDSHRIFQQVGLIEVAERLGEAGRTFPSFSPKLSLDKMFVRGFRPLEWRVPDIKTAWLSDHLPYIARLGLLK